MELLKKSPQAELTVFSPLHPPETVPLPESLVTIGRASDCTIPIRDRFLSRRHAEIVPVAGDWILKDCGSANGTWVNGRRVERETVLSSGDRIRLGDSEIVFQMDDLLASSIAVGETHVAATISIPYRDIVDTQPGPSIDLARLRILNALASELIEDHPLDRLFGFVVDRIAQHLSPSRVAIALLNDEGSAFTMIEVRRAAGADDGELTISRTLLREVVDERRVLAFIDTAGDERLASSKSIVMQGIRSAIIAPLLIEGIVAGVLYLDYQQANRPILDEDVHLLGQIARLASLKLETTRLREAAIQKRLIEEELRTAASIQRGLLPREAPRIPGYTVAGSNRPCQTVSGDYYDCILQPDGRLWFIIADVAGKGVTAALIMASLQSAFRILVKDDPIPDRLASRLNEALRESLSNTRFVTLILGRLDPRTGTLEFTNAGHPHPIHVSPAGTAQVGFTNLLVGLFPIPPYVTQTAHLEPGESFVLFTDGAFECCSDDGKELGIDGVRRAVEASWGHEAEDVAETLRGEVLRHVKTPADLNDDLTLLVLSRDKA
jgi:serine phosphatase RsbU (regulator of sigma subunit)